MPALAPIVEEIAEMLRNAPLPALLTQKKRSAARPQNNGIVKEHKPQSVIAPRYCKRCGEVVSKGRRVFCSDNCRTLYQQWELAERKNEIAANEAQAIAVPDDTPIVVSERIVTLEEYQTEIAPRLADVRVATLCRATGLSRAYCKQIKRGRVPHLRHWTVLRAQVTERNDGTPQGEDMF